ncbi:uncharacterized protein LOC114535607 [Dendronephthya gigantea]|uniref:uncharacterized protein LOC114535607 n=1 Tax=Dendronephthya gigantea TaxID=151771 RepID=UPI00106B29FB|nr:uncharacterized protein LOC114535607 [Dendronephthya gigantea]
MTKLILLLVFAGASAIIPWRSNPILPGYPIFFNAWGSFPYCDTLYKDEKQCFEDCMTAKGFGANIDQANYKEPGACPPTLPGCFPPWRPTACQCARRCECKLGRCEHEDNCPYCRKRS